MKTIALKVTALYERLLGTRKNYGCGFLIGPKDLQIRDNAAGVPAVVMDEVNYRECKECKEAS